MKTINQKKKLFYIHFTAFVLGCFSLFSFAPYNLFFLNFLIFTSFLLIFYKNKKILTLKHSFVFGCAFGFGYFLSNIHWITISLTFDESFTILIPVALIIIPLFLSVFIGLATMFCQKYVDNKVSFIIYFSILFSLFEFIRGTILTVFPWNLISYTWSQSIESIQILSLIAPSVICLLIWMLVPLILAINFSFQDYYLQDLSKTGYVGFKNYYYLFSNKFNFLDYNLICKGK